MKYYLLLALLLPFSALGIEFEGASQKPVEVKAEASSGLNGIYVVADTYGMSIVYTAGSSTGEVVCKKYSRMGASYAEEISSRRDGAKVTVSCEPGDMGYVFEENGRSQYFWIINYADHFLDLEAINLSAEQDCDRTHFDFTGKAAALEAFSPLGRRIVVSRDLKLEYSTLSFDEESFTYRQERATTTLDGIESTFSVDAPLCDTSFELTGDRFLQAWGQEQSVESATFTTLNVAAETRATQAERNNDNEQRVEAELGGSAPVDITFEAAVSDAAIFAEWQISRMADFSDVINSFSEHEFTYTFTEQGTTYVRFTANNADGTCPFEGDVYQVMIGESKLDIPNAFSPGTSPGVNDEWKVSYKSLVSYKCTIVNRWGKKLFESDNPAEGWDGMIGGKPVPAGVYFYVIKAVGADGVKYNKAGDINVIGFKDNTTNSNNTDTE